MNWIESLFYGLVSGISEFLPIASRAHQSFLYYIYGIVTPDPVMQLFVHGAIFAALYISSKPYIEQLRRTQSSLRYTGRRRTGPKITPDEKLARNAALLTIIVAFLLSYLVSGNMPLPLVAIMLILNGLLLYLPDRFAQGNKDAGSMSMLDSWLMGIASSLCFLPGFSGIGSAVSVSVLRGADRKKALNWALLIAFYTLGTAMVLDVFAIISGNGTVPFFKSFLCYITAAAGAYISGFIGVKLIKYFTLRRRYTGFAYYSWGMALFIFLIYLIVI